MRKRIFPWLAAVALAAALAAGLLNGGATAPVVYGADPTPTAAAASASGLAPQSRRPPSA